MELFLGLNGPVVKSHGSTDSVGFYHSIDLCYKIIKGNLMSQIKNNLSHLDVKAEKKILQKMIYLKILLQKLAFLKIIQKKLMMI